MRLYLDDALLTGDAPLNLTEALELAKPQAAERGRIIVEVWTDGARVADNELARLSGDARMNAGELRLVTEDPRAVVKQALEETASSLEAMRDVHLEASDLIQSGNPETAVELVGRIAAVWDGVRQTLDEGGRLIDTRFDEMEGAAAAIGSLTVRLSGLARAIDRKDWVALADDLAEELPQEATRWAALLRGFSRQVG